MVIAADEVGVQSFRARFKERRPNEAPSIAQWRCNLTGLSQLHNLYFVAYTSDIYVYIPEFPTQRISEEPAVIFTSQPSAPRLAGYLDRRYPHAVNSLIVQFLGNEEVVAAVRDDGDVDAFLVRHIVHAIARRSEPRNELPLRSDEIRPFFQSNVGASAWGLAVHAQARILATSANTHEVRVFKFGLLQADDEDEGSESDKESNGAADEERDINNDSERKTDVTYRILNGEANIPYISFCNTGDDPLGRWLLTTDISGVCQVMDLHDMKSIYKFRFGQSLRMPIMDRFDRFNAGWILMFLDKRSFQVEINVEAALGLGDDERLPDMKRTPDIWDLSKTVQHLPEYSEPFIYHGSKRRKQMGVRSSSNPLNVEDTTDSAVADPDEGDEHGDIESDTSTDGGAPLDIEPSASVSEEPHEQAAESLPQEPSEQELDDLDHNSNATDSDEDITGLIDDAEDYDDEMTEDSVPFNSVYGGSSICANVPQFVSNDSKRCYDLPCPIMHSSMRNIYLLQPFTPEGSTPYSPPMVGLANPLRQTIQQDFEYLRIFERLNMAVYLRPLGVVVVASQKGRALVLSLTKIRAGTPYPEEMATRGPMSPDPSQTVHNSWLNKSNYTFRIECILPFAHQEKANQRPFAGLHGIAASPLQGLENGHSNGEGTGRWRVMIMYQDHSILSYEIGRRIGKDGKMNGLDVEDLLV